MKRYIHKILAVSAAVLMTTVMAGCADEVEVDPVKLSETNTINLTVNVPMETPTGRAGEEDPLNEFTVKSLHLYFYRAAGHDDATSEYVLDYTVSEEFIKNKTIGLGLPADAFNDGGLIGTTGTECIVYAVANVDPALLTAKTIDGFKKIVVGSNFMSTTVQGSFAMDGIATLTADRNKRQVSGEIVLERAAAKLTLAANVPETIEVNGTGGTTVVYTAHKDEMRVWIANGVFQSELNTAPKPVKKEWLYSNALALTYPEPETAEESPSVLPAGSPSGSGFAADEVDLSSVADPSTTKRYKVQSIPFYSYPNKWEQESLDGNCYLTLELPWSHEENGTTVKQKTYYRLAVRSDESEIRRNTYYDMRVVINRLGGSADKPVDMKAEWMYVLPWKTETLTTDIKRVRYLLLNNNDWDENIGAYSYIMDNEEETSITFGSSHEVEIAEVKLTWHDYLKDKGDTDPTNYDRTITLTEGTGTYPYSSTIAGYTQPTTQYAGIEVDNTTSTLKLSRKMLHLEWNNNRASIKNATAFNSYTFEIVLRHTDEAGKNQTAKVRITQYPPIYIEAERTENGNTRFVNNNNEEKVIDEGTWWSPNEVQKGYILMNPGQDPGTSEDYYLGSVHDKYANNQNTYVLTISRFADNEENEYIIADPRTREVDNLNLVSGEETDKAAWSIKVNNEQLEHYYPADNSEDKTRYIAPKIRVASQWGVTFNMSENGAKRRCASYQENGRPAGRWRLPTIAEIEFIANLSSKYYIPFLFGDDGDNNNAKYWCASGVVNVYNNSKDASVTPVPNPGSRYSVRCVYDEWYWTEDNDVLTDKTKFTWGDRPRTMSGN